MIGQINRGSKLGEIIYDFCKLDEVKTIVEIGTWNGMGSTKCIYDAIYENNVKDYQVYSLESNVTFYNQAINNLPKIDNLKIILGRIIEVEDLVDIDKCDDKFFQPITNKEIMRGWLKDDLENYKNVPNVLDKLPEKIDLLILDGGEFSSLAEFKVLKERTSYFILDDTLLIKNSEVSEIMRKSDEFQVIEDNINDRNGYMVAKKVK